MSTALAKVSPSPHSVSQRGTAQALAPAQPQVLATGPISARAQTTPLEPRTVPHRPNICPGRIQCNDCTCVDTVNKRQEWTGLRARNCGDGPLMLALGPYSANPPVPAPLPCKEDRDCIIGKCVDGECRSSSLTAKTRGGRRLVPLGVTRANNPWTTWWGYGPGTWQWRPPTAPAVPWGSYAYYGNVWPWNGVTAPMPNVRTRKHRRYNPDPPIFPGPGAHSKFAPLPPQWFYYQQPTTMGAPYEGMIPAAAPGPPPGVYGRGGQCYSDRDCRPETEYCHQGICLPKPWSPHENPVDTLCHCDYEGTQCKCTVCYQEERGDRPSCIQFPIPDQKKSAMPVPSATRFRALNPAEMISMSRPLAPGIQLR